MVLGSTVSGRESDTVSTVGCLINTLPLVVDVKSEQLRSDFLSTVQAQHLEMQRYAAVPLSTIQAWSGRPAGVGLFDTIVVVENFSGSGHAALEGTGLREGQVDIFEFSHYGTALIVEPSEKQLVIYLISNGERYSEKFAGMLLARFEKILLELACGLGNTQEASNQKLGSIGRLSRVSECVDVGRAVSFNAGDVLASIAGFSNEATDRIALSSHGRQVTYGELWAWSGRAAAMLSEAGCRKGARVGVLGGRSVEFVVGIIGVLRVGAVYVPLDAGYPAERIAFMTDDAELSFVLVDSSAPLGDGGSVPRLSIPTEGGEGSFTGPILRDDDDAYLIYTSGSSGQPKGVLLTHGNLAWTTAARCEFYGDAVPKSFLLLSSFSFDSSVAGLFWTLSVGGKIVLPRKGQENDPRSVSETIHREGVTHTLCLPSLWELILEFGGSESLQSLCCVAVAGETCLPRVASRHFSMLPQVQLVNEYGPTEGAVWCAAYSVCADSNLERIPIGKAIPGAQIVVLDESRRPIRAAGVVGEVFLGGAGVAKGYWKRESETKCRFVAPPAGLEEMGTLYRTGDLVFRSSEGNLVFLGRKDEQVKVRGHRIEIAEVELAIKRCSTLTEVVVLVPREGEGGQYEGRLVAFVQCLEPGQRTAKYSEDLRSRLSLSLPSYMVPSVLELVDELPRLPNGKIDREALLARIGESFDLDDRNDGVENLVVLTESEKILVDIWSATLQTDIIEPNDSFYELGGDSLMSIRVASLARERGLELSPSDFADETTIRGLAGLCDARVNNCVSENGVSDIVESPSSPITPIQSWFFECDHAVPDHWNQTLRLDLDESVKLENVLTAIETLLSHHSTLRTRFERKGLDWRCEIMPASLVRISVEKREFSKAGDRESAISEAVIKGQEGLAIDDLPWCRVTIIEDVATKRLVVLLIVHHLQIDLFSWRILSEDLDRLLSGRTISGSKASFDAWARELQDRSDTGFFDSEETLWKQVNTGGQVGLPRDKEGASVLLERDRLVQRIEWDANQAERLILKPCSDWRIRPQELFLAALARALLHWLDRSAVRIDLEQHGRASFLGGLDISRTVGWFTSYFPVAVPRLTSNETIGWIKETVRSIPHGGLGFGALRYLSRNEERVGELKALGSSDVLFNYTGDLLMPLEKTESGVILKSSFPEANARSSKNRQSHLFEIDVSNDGGRFHLDWSYNKNAFEEKTVSGLLSTIQREIEELARAASRQDGRGMWSPSDFVDSEIDQEDLNALLGDL